MYFNILDQSKMLIFTGRPFLKFRTTGPKQTDTTAKEAEVLNYTINFIK